MPTADHPTPRPPLGRTVWALALVSFLTDASSEMIYPLLPVFLTGTLGAGVATLGMIEGAAESVASLLKLASGWWSDRVRRRKPLIVAGYALASLARPLVAIAQSAGQVLAIRLTDRVGKGIRGAPRDALIADSVDAAVRGRAFGVHRAADHAGAVVGPLVAFALLGAGVGIRSVFWFAAIPGALAVVVAVVLVRERGHSAAVAPPVSAAAAGVAVRRPDLSQPMDRRFWSVMGAILLFTLGNSTDAFLLLRAAELGVPVPLVPILWAALHVVKSASSVPGGMLSDRLGRTPTMVAGWLLYAAVYLLFGVATEAWQAWALFLAYGVYFGLTEGVERALIADIVPADRRGTAYGWYALVVGVGALPASLLFGAVWQGWGAPAAFVVGAGLALLAAVALVLARAGTRRSGR
jgi:MFS family permease